MGRSPQGVTGRDRFRQQLSCWTLPSSPSSAALEELVLVLRGGSLCEGKDFVTLCPGPQPLVVVEGIPKFCSLATLNAPAPWLHASAEPSQAPYRSQGLASAQKQKTLPASDCNCF